MLKKHVHTYINPGPYTPTYLPFIWFMRFVGKPMDCLFSDLLKILDSCFVACIQMCVLKKNDITPLCTVIILVAFEIRQPSEETAFGQRIITPYFPMHKTCMYTIL